ncbi:MAG: hypothetical protein LUE92_04650, partial [Clostridiales bacterium]|nr:hypothetical protein [Clostridiales bacterium]
MGYPCSSLHCINESRATEPSCGNGNFLIEILRRKLERCKDMSEGLVALKSIYGVDILPDNIEESRERMREVWMQYFDDNEQIDKILKRNIVRENFLEMDAEHYWEE